MYTHTHTHTQSHAVTTYLPLSMLHHKAHGCAIKGGRSNNTGTLLGCNTDDRFGVAAGNCGALRDQIHAARLHRILALRAGGRVGLGDQVWMGWQQGRGVDQVGGGIGCRRTEGDR